jgi:hypothetical protein
MRRLYLLCLLIGAVMLAGCASTQEIRKMEVTGYCGCGKCCCWERGNWKYLKLDVWNKYVSKGKNKGKTYTGNTASGTKPHTPHPGLFSFDSVKKPWMIPVRVIFFPWLLLPRDGTIAADTRYYRFGTRMYVPGYGWGVVEDRGSAIKGSRRLDLYYNSHTKALNWGRKKVNVRIKRKR